MIFLTTITCRFGLFLALWFVELFALAVGGLYLQLPRCLVAIFRDVLVGNGGHVILLDGMIAPRG
jgi:hypothetical protein